MSCREIITIEKVTGGYVLEYDCYWTTSEGVERTREKTCFSYEDWPEGKAQEAMVLVAWWIYEKIGEPTSKYSKVRFTAGTEPGENYEEPKGKG